MKLLIAEDEADLARVLKALFEKSGYTADVVGNGNDAYDYASEGDYDGIVMDIMMPGMDGVSVLSALRASGKKTPVLLLTAKSGINDRVEGLDAGADDYLPKPFDAQELLARVRAMLRRRENYTGDELSFEGLSLNLSTFELSYKGKSLRLQSRELQMLQMLMESKGIVVSSDSFMEHIWGWETDADVSTVWVYISNLRKKIAELSAPVSIKAVRGVGYTLIAGKG